MDINPIEIRDFLARHHPFDLLPDSALDDLPGKIQNRSARPDDVIIRSGDECRFLYIVCTGAVETHSPDGGLLARLAEGEAFGVHAMLNNCQAINQVTAIENSLFYLLPYEEFERLRLEYPQFAYFFAPFGAARLREAKAHGRGNSDDQINLMSYRTANLLTRPPVTIGRDAVVREAAQMMRTEGVSCILVTDGDDLTGIVTDRDLRNRVVAEGLGQDVPVEHIMTRNPISLDADSYAFDALLTMTRQNIRHLPIMQDGKIAGVVTNSNLIQQQTKSAVFLVGDIYKKTTFEGLADVVTHMPDLLLHLVDAGATHHNVGHIITSVTDAITMRLVRLAEAKQGPPPVPYLWLASGSQARHEQTGVSDQDNCMILDDTYDEATHGAYFREMANFVCDGLNACGYVYCPGDMMATTDQWRQPLARWKKYFSKWIEEPEPMALMLSCIFFDLRPIIGEMSMFDELQSLILEKAERNRIFLAHMVGNALTHSPPLGFFRNFVLIKDTEHKNEFDLKHNGVVPIVDIARVYALQTGVDAVNTDDRLLAERDLGAMSKEGASDLLDAYEFISTIRLKHQADQIRAGQKPDNFMSPKDLSQFERNHLKDAFSVVKTMQTAMASAHHV